MAALVLFLLTAVMYFVPQVDVPHKIFLPLLLMGLLTIGIAPWQISVALLFSALGDLSGSFKYASSPDGGFLAFVGQMLFFALAHVFFVTYFIAGARKPGKERAGSLYLLAAVLVCAVPFITVMRLVVPCVDAGVLRICVSAYAVIITVMLFSALMLRDWVSGIGAALFVTSDFILAWNMFVSPLNGSTYLIMVPYYLAQLLIASRAVQKAGRWRAPEASAAR